MKKFNNKKGFTIVELVIVIAVIGILAGVLIPTFSNVISKANKTSALEDSRNALTSVIGMSSNGVVTEGTAFVYYDADGRLTVHKYTNNALSEGAEADIKRGKVKTIIMNDSYFDLNQAKTAVTNFISTNTTKAAEAKKMIAKVLGVKDSDLEFVSKTDPATNNVIKYVLKFGTETNEGGTATNKTCEVLVNSDFSKKIIVVVPELNTAGENNG